MADAVATQTIQDGGKNRYISGLPTSVMVQAKAQ